MYVDRLEGGVSRTMTRPLALAPSVEIVPVAELPADVRGRLAGSESDCILSDPTSRVNSMRIDAHTAELLGRFTDPSRIVDAVIEHATTRPFLRRRGRRTHPAT